MTKLALVGISEPGEEDWFSAPWWFEPFGINPPAMRTLLPKAIAKAVVAPGCRLNITFRPFPMPPGEPEAVLFTWPGARCGLAMLVRKQGGERMLTAAWPFTTDGVGHELVIDRVCLAPDRLQAVVKGTLGDILPLAWHDVLFPVDRAFYAEGSVHQVLLAGIAHQFAVVQPEPIALTPDAPSYAVLRGENPSAVNADGSILIHTKGMAVIFPIQDDLPGLYSIQGPVKRVEKYTGNLFDREVWDVRVTVARIGEEVDYDVDLSVLVSDLVLDGAELPKIGDDIAADIRLQGRIWSPNVDMDQQ